MTGKFRHLPVVENGEVVALLDITKCLYDAIARMERAAEKGNAIAAAVENVEREWSHNASGELSFSFSAYHGPWKLVVEFEKLSIIMP